MFLPIFSQLKQSERFACSSQLLSPGSVLSSVQTGKATSWTYAPWEAKVSPWPHPGLTLLCCVHSVPLIYRSANKPKSEELSLSHPHCFLKMGWFFDICLNQTISKIVINILQKKIIMRINTYYVSIILCHTYHIRLLSLNP